MAEDFVSSPLLVIRLFLAAVAYFILQNIIIAAQDCDSKLAAGQAMKLRATPAKIVKKFPP